MVPHLQDGNLSPVFRLLILGLPDCCFQLGNLFVLSPHHRPQLPDAVVVPHLILGDGGHATTLVAGHWPLRVMCTLLQVPRQVVQAQDRFAAMAVVVASDLQPKDNMVANPDIMNSLGGGGLASFLTYLDNRFLRILGTG